MPYPSDPSTGISRRRLLSHAPLAIAALPAGSARAADVVPPAGAAMLSVRDAGASGRSDGDDTAAFQRAIDQLAAGGGGTLYLPPGTYRTGSVDFPPNPAVIHVEGAGSLRSIWEMAAPDQPVIRMNPAMPGTRVTGSRFRRFGIRAHPAGTVDNPRHVAIDACGFNAVHFDDLRFLSHRGGSVHSWFRTAAHPRPTYHQRFSGLVCDGNVGPGHVVRTANGGDTLTNTNLIEIDGFWIYANEGMRAAFDLSCCTGYSIRDGLIESSAQTGIVLGNAGVVESIWIEDVATPLRFATARGMVGASNNALRSVYLSGFSGQISIPRDCVNNSFHNVTGGRFQILREDAFGGNLIVNSSGMGGKPVIGQFAGTTGHIREVTAVAASSLDGLWHLLYEFVPPAPGAFGFRLQPPAGYRVKRSFATAMDGANGIPYPCATGWPITDFFLTAPNSRPVLIVVQCAYE